MSFRLSFFRLPLHFIMQTLLTICLAPITSTAPLSVTPGAMAAALRADAAGVTPPRKPIGTAPRIPPRLLATHTLGYRSFDAAGIGPPLLVNGAPPPPIIPPRPPATHKWGERALEDALLLHGKDLTVGAQKPKPQRTEVDAPRAPSSVCASAQTVAAPPSRAAPGAASLSAAPLSASDALEARLSSAQLIVLSTPEEHAAALSKMERIEAELAVVQHQLREVEIANYSALVRDEARLAVEASACAEAQTGSARNEKGGAHLTPAMLAAVELEIERRRVAAHTAARSPNAAVASTAPLRADDGAPINVRKAMAQYDYLQSRGVVPAR